MIRQLAIHNVVLVERLELEFAPGLGVLTGETGAGKSILLDSLGLALGARSDAGLVRNGAETAAVSVEFMLAADHPALALLAEQGLDADCDEPLILRRTLKADGGSRAFLGAAAVPAATLRDIAGLIVEIHGQNDDRGLLNPRGHRDLLDSFGKLDLAPLRAAWDERARLADELERARAEAEAAARDRDYLEHCVGEIAALAPQPGEDSALAERRAAMQAGARAGESLEGIDDLLGGSDGAIAQLRTAARRIERAGIDHPLLTEALEALDRSLIEANEAEDRIARALVDLDSDPARLDEVEARLFDIRALARKHRVEPDDLAALGDRMSEQLRAIDAGGEQIAALERALDEAEQHYLAQAAQVSERRRTAAAELDVRVNEELKPLKLDAASFATMVDTCEAGANGIDRVEFMVATNPGEPFGPLTKIASGGEMSRFVLALKVALADAGSAGTLIFDEIDRGVGGAVASAIGERLARLSNDAQVLVVTHSPQVAARAAHHYRIEKRHGPDGTRTHVARLSVEERREEIARMLSGEFITDEARAQATKLLEAA